MPRSFKITTCLLLVATSLISTPLLLNSMTDAVEAAPRTRGRPGRVEPSGPRIQVPILLQF